MVRQILVFFIIIIGLMIFNTVDGIAQVQVTATPVQVVLPTQTPLPTQISLSTATPTITPTEQGFVLLQKAVTVDENTPVNVRGLPGPGEPVVGFLENGQQYRVIGRYISWYQIDYDPDIESAWVFSSVVEIIGEDADIPSVDPFVEPTATPVINQLPLDADEFDATLAVITLTPDAILTVTAQQRVINVPQGTPEPDDVLPTFTPLANVDIAPVSAPSASGGALEEDRLTDLINTLTSGQLPPIFPILVLGGVGIIGLLLSALFRR